ncbi:hypothetical protein CC78DRAFT_586367 [Lojkania enalia]|uniref:Uncharacterized protein n=1 Tax=Lojkania enalia TaxID=147567 RepID=A0A9P4N560_9PLEO|nr:hypothetical protein CC78DRAFT_586367 [Didymosphaeria enalia]
MATDSRDKIYARFSLAREMETDRLESHINANYALYVEYLFVQIAAGMVSGPEPLRLFRSIDESNRRPGSPFMGTRLERPTRIKPLSALCNSAYMLNPRRVYVMNDPNRRLLKIAGKEFDRILDIEEPIIEIEGDIGLKTVISWNNLAKKHKTCPIYLFA